MNGKNVLLIEKMPKSERYFDYYRITGLTEEEINYIRGGKDNEEDHRRLAEVLENHGKSEGICWLRGYGIYSLYMHPREPLVMIVQVGDSCD